MASKSASQSKTLWRLFGFLGPWRSPYFIGLVVLAILHTSERIFIGYVIKLFVDSIVNQDMPLLWNSVKLWGLFLLGWIPANALLSNLWRSLLVRAVTNLRQRIFSHMQRLPLGYHEQRHSGDLISVLTNDVTTAEQAFQQDMFTLVNATLQGVSAAAFMLVLNWQLALVTIFCGLVPLIINSVFAKPLRKSGDAIQERLGGVSERLADLLAGIQVVRTYGLAEWILSRFNRSNRELLESSLRRVNLQSALDVVNELGGALLSLGPLVVGSYLASIGQTTFGILVAFIQLNNCIFFFVYSLGGTISRIQASLAAADRILALTDAAPEPEKYGRVGLEPEKSPDALLEFKEVHFGYDSQQPILQGMSFQVRPGQVAAFVGPSGGGKSTIFKLLLGCYPVRHGAVFVRGRSANDYYLSELRSQFAYIPQDAYLYSGSVMENIHYGRTDASHEEVIEAARAAYAHEFISEFPDGYWTTVGERGARLSGGQRQRIAIARALLKNAPILLLDEATSALDSESEEVVQRALEVLMRGRTVLIIAHRLSTIENAGIIYVVNDGQVVESGTHDELLNYQGLFYHLHELQFREEDEQKAGEPALHAADSVL